MISKKEVLLYLEEKVEDLNSYKKFTHLSDHTNSQIVSKCLLELIIDAALLYQLKFGVKQKYPIEKFKELVFGNILQGTKLKKDELLIINTNLKQGLNESNYLRLHICLMYYLNDYQDVKVTKTVHLKKVLEFMIKYKLYNGVEYRRIGEGKIEDELDKTEKGFNQIRAVIEHFVNDHWLTNEKIPLEVIDKKDTLKSLRMELEDCRKKCGSRYLKGGVVLGAGSFGKVISPAIPCKRDQVENLDTLATKIFKPEKQEEFARETNIRLRGILKDIDPNQERFTYAIYTSEECKPEYIFYLNPQTKEDIKNILGPARYNEDLLTNSFQHFTMKKMAPPDEIQVNMRLPVNVTYIEESLQMLHAAGIVHNDLHIGNIAYGSSDFRPRIFDFGKFKFKSELTEEEWEYLKNNDYKIIRERQVPQAPTRKRFRGEF